ncbi:MAG: hypothetical protein Q7K35_01455 [bacterium]|nr:hypothetical protein [bacterium]
MKRILFFILPAIFFILVSLPAQAETKTKIYEINIRYLKGAVTINNIIVKDGYPRTNSSGNLPVDKLYTIELRSFTNKILEQTKFNISRTLMPPPPLEGDKSPTAPIILDDVTEIISLAYHKDGKLLILYGPDNTKLDQADIGYFGDVCGDKVCQDHESFENCPKDCLAGGKDDWCNEEQIGTDPDCQKAATAANLLTPEKKSSSALFFWLIAGALAIFLIIIGSIFYIRGRKEGGEPTI